MTDEHVQPLALVNKQIKGVVESELLDKPLWTGGFISRVHLADSGHIYFTLSEGDFSIRCMLYENRRGDMPFTPQDGMEVELRGVVGVFDERAMIQLEVEQMRLLEGQPVSNFAPVRERLKGMGLYPPQKRPLPAPIGRIALLTSRNSMAEDDFRENYEPAGPRAKVHVEDVRVEGEFAARDIADAIQRINQNSAADVIVLTRGGGRRQVLAAVFDDLLVAEAICRSRIPIVTAIGHARDRTLADELADASADTPTAAAHLLARYSKSPSTSPEAGGLPIVPILLALLLVMLAIVAALISQL